MRESRFEEVDVSTDRIARAHNNADLNDSCPVRLAGPRVSVPRTARTGVRDGNCERIVSPKFLSFSKNLSEGVAS